MQQEPAGTAAPVGRSPAGIPPADTMTLADYVLILWRRKRLVAACVVAGVALALLAHFALPKKYEAAALILPPQDEGGGGLAAKLAGLAADLPAALPGVKRPSERYVDMLESRRVADEAIARFDLMKRYGKESRDGTRQKLAARRRFKITKGELISISATDEDPEVAAQMANFFAEVLGRIDREINVGEAGRQRRFLDTRLKEVEKDLKAAQGAWRAFQEKHRIVRVDEGLRATATVIAELEAQRIAKEIQLQVMETVYSKTNPQVEVLRSEVSKLGEKLKELAGKGIRTGAGERSQWLFPAIEKVPALALEQMDLERRLRLQAELYRLLVTQREMARIEEAKENPSLQVVSEAGAPDRPAGMGGPAKLLLGAVLGFLAGVALIWFLEVLFPGMKRPVGP